MAYFLPWSSGEDGLLIWASSELMGDITRYLAPLLASAIICFVAVLASLALALCALLSKSRGSHFVQAASLLNGVAISGPLLFYPGWLLRSRSDWPDYWQAIDGADVGWFLTLLFGSGAWVLFLLAFDEVSREAEKHVPPRRASPRFALRSNYTLATLLPATIGAAVAVIGYAQTWGSGTEYVINTNMSWSRTGFDSSPPMILVPVAAVAWCLALLVRQFMRDGGIAALLLASEGALVAALTLTLFWGIAVWEHEIWPIDPYGSYASTTTLEKGWYMSVAGQSIIVVSMLLHHLLPRYSPKGVQDQ